MKLQGFVQAWITDIEYNYWQNAADPLEYTSKGRSIEGLPMKLNGLPYPLEQLVVDTSQNPARREIRESYAAATGNPMWMGKSFWKYSVSSKENVMKESGEKATELENGIIYINVIDGLFMILRQISKINYENYYLGKFRFTSK